MSSCILNLFTQLTTGCFVNISRCVYFASVNDIYQAHLTGENISDIMIISKNSGGRCTFISSTCEMWLYSLNLGFFVSFAFKYSFMLFFHIISKTSTGCTFIQTIIERIHIAYYYYYHSEKQRSVLLLVYPAVCILSLYSESQYTPRIN